MIRNGLGQLTDHTGSCSFSFTSLEEVKIIINLISKKSPEFNWSGFFFNFRS